MASPPPGRLRSLLQRRLLECLQGPELDARLAAAARRAFTDPEVKGQIAAVARASRLSDHVIFGDPGRVSVGQDTQLNDALLNVTSGTIRIEASAFLGHGVSLLTGTHDIERYGIERQQAVPPSGRDIVVERGAWLASGVIVLGPCRIGEHAVVAAGAIVLDDVPPGTVVAGVPARPTGRTLTGAVGS